MANADYVAKMTGIDTREVVLMKVDGPLDVARSGAVDATKTLPGVVISDLSQATHLIGILVFLTAMLENVSLYKRPHSLTVICHG